MPKLFAAISVMTAVTARRTIIGYFSATAELFVFIIVVDFFLQLFLSNALHNSIEQNIKSLVCPVSDIRSPMSDVRSECEKRQMAIT